MPIPPIYVDIVPLHVGWVHDSRQHMQNARHCSPAFAIFDPDQFRTIPESRFVLWARRLVVPSVFLKNVPVLPQLFISPPDDRRWSIIHTMHPNCRTLFLVCSDHSDTFHYTLDTLQVPFSLLSTRSISQVLRLCRATPFAPKTRFLIISPQMSGVNNVYFTSTATVDLGRTVYPTQTVLVLCKNSKKTWL
jgi:hypothetical protein